MLTKTFAKSSAPILIALTCLAGCGEDQGPPEDTAVESETSAIFNGSPMSEAGTRAVGLVAIYHPGPGMAFQPRPCSGVIVRSQFSHGAPFSWVLTTRHCVTVDGSSNTPLAPPSALRLLPGVNPGIANPNPPPGAVTPFSIMVFGNSLVAVAVAVDWTAIAGHRLGIYVGPTSSLWGGSFQAAGYGLNAADAGCQSNLGATTGAGTARSAGMFAITQPFNDHRGQPSGYWFNNSAPNNWRLTCGDSGGPNTNNLGTVALKHILGVSEVGSGNPGRSHGVAAIDFQEFIQPYLSVGNIGAAPPAMKNIGVQATNRLQFVPAGHFAQSQVTYNNATRRIAFSNPSGCLGTMTDGSGAIQPVLETCDANDPGQSWSVRIDLTIRNDQAGRCLVALADTNVTTAACSATNKSQQWIFHPQP